MHQNKYNDKKLFLWIIPFVNVINYYLTYSTFSPFWKLFATFFIDTLQGYIAWWIVRVIILWLDKKISFESNLIKRIIIQLILTLFAGSLSIILLTEFTNWLATSKPVPLSFYTKDMPIISIWFFVLNGIYIGMHFYQKWKQTEEIIKEERKIKKEGFKVSSTKKEIVVPFNEIYGFYFDGDYSVMVSKDSKKHFLDFSLDKVEKTLIETSFFRLNRQFIIHRQLIIGFEKGDDGKINVLLKDNGCLPTNIAVSRTRAPKFKIWFAPI